MTTLKVMSIIGIVWFSLCLIFILAFIETDIEAAAGWGIFAFAYGLPFSIVGLVQAGRHKK